MRDSSSSSPAAVRGRPFVTGNPGRKRGSQNRITKIATALLAEEADELVRRAVEIAMNGDVAMLRFLLSRILPRDRTIKIDIAALERADDAVEATAAIMSEVAEGKISPAEGAALVVIVKANQDAIDLAAVVKRLDVLESKRSLT